MSQLDIAAQQALTPGFADPVFGAQETFRKVLTAMSEPGTIVEIGAELDPPAPLNRATGAIALTLMDFETDVWLDEYAASGAAAQWLRFHCGASLADRESGAPFAIIGDPLASLPLDRFDAGTDEYPERGATLIIQTGAVRTGAGLTLTGPGIEGSREVVIEGLPGEFWEQRAQTNTLFPHGIDLVLTSGGTAVAIPRTTNMEAS